MKRVLWGVSLALSLVCTLALVRCVEHPKRDVRTERQR